MKIKILVLNIDDLGGIERVAVNLCNMFLKSKQFTDIEIVSVNGSDSVKNSRVLKGNSEGSKLLNFAKSLDKDTIVLSLYDRFSIKLALIRRLYHLSFYLTACQHADYYAHRLHTRLLRLLTYKWVDKIIALTQEDALLYKKHFKNIEVIPNSLSFYPEKVVSVNSRSISSAVAGRLVPIKQYEHFIYFIGKVWDSNKVFKIFGEGPERQKLESLCQELELKHEEILFGKSNEIEEKLNDIRFFVVTSLRESFSMVILEAMACGCIVISYDCPTGPRELIDNGINGFLIPINDIDALTQCYQSLESNPELCQKISDNARAYSKNFLDNKIIVKWRKVLDGE